MDAVNSREKIIKILQKPVWTIPGVGDKTVKLFQKLEINTVFDLINHYPRGWLDLRFTTAINSLKIGDLAIISGTPGEIGFFITKKRGIKVLSAKITTDEGSILAFWFNQVYLKNSLAKIEKAIFVGKVEYNKTFGKFIASPKIYYKKEIIPIYPLTSGLSQYMIRKAIHLALNSVQIEDFIPKEDLLSTGYIDINQALRAVHLPDDPEILDKSKKRLAFNEMFYVNLSLLKNNRKTEIDCAKAFEPDFEAIKHIIENLSFKLTDAQRKEVYTISKLLNETKPMQRLLQGDVGSGKTIVAALSAIAVIKNGYRVVCMAPTEILARQHFDSFSALFAQKYKVALVVGARKDDWRDADIIIGTQALIQKNISFDKLGLVIIDEQHRFGTNQRNILLKQEKGIFPHYLAMSATPIPRSLAQIIYGHLSLGKLNEMPEGRKAVITKVFPETERSKVYTFIDSLIEKGEQAFVVCPKIEQSEIINEDYSGQAYLDFDKKSVIEEFEKLRKSVFSHRKIAMLHGKMKSDEKNAILTDFREKKFDILVSTAVIEVGIDIPNASVVLIESAERFGLAQLHQFRGRVGRAGQQAYCYLSCLDNVVNERVQIMEKENDGFKLAEYDLQQRGPGDFIGTRQSGLPDFKMAEFSNIILLDEAKEYAKEFIQKYPNKNELLDYFCEEFFSKNKV